MDKKYTAKDMREEARIFEAHGCIVTEDDFHRYANWNEKNRKEKRNEHR